jgi:hypothetical protein
MNANHIATSFDILVEEFARAIAEANTKGADAFGRKDYRAVKALAETATRLNEYRSKVVALKEQWNAHTPSGGEPRKKHGRGKAHPPTHADFRAHCMQAIETKRRLTLKKKTPTQYVSGDGTTAVVCAVAQQNPAASVPYYWFTIHHYQVDLLAKHKQGFLVLGCDSPGTIFAIAFRAFEPWSKKLNTDYKRDGTYHSHIVITGESSRFYLHLKGRGEKVEITRFLLK